MRLLAGRRPPRAPACHLIPRTGSPRRLSVRHAIVLVVSTATDWDAWHRPYEDANSPLSRRLRIIQAHIAEWLDSSPASSPLTVLSSCSGDGRDLLDVPAGRTDADRVAATLMDSDSRNIERARQSASNAGPADVNDRHVDATSSDAYVGALAGQNLP